MPVLCLFGSYVRCVGSVVLELCATLRVAQTPKHPAQRPSGSALAPRRRAGCAQTQRRRTRDRSHAHQGSVPRPPSLASHTGLAYLGFWLFGPHQFIASGLGRASGEQPLSPCRCRLVQRSRCCDSGAGPAGRVASCERRVPPREATQLVGERHNARARSHTAFEQIDPACELCPGFSESLKRALWNMAEAPAS